MRWLTLAAALLVSALLWVVGLLVYWPAMVYGCAWFLLAIVQGWRLLDKMQKGGGRCE